jgi:hypothetical protein
VQATQATTPSILKQPQIAAMTTVTLTTMRKMAAARVKTM